VFSVVHVGKIIDHHCLITYG